MPEKTEKFCSLRHQVLSKLKKFLRVAKVVACRKGGNRSGKGNISGNTCRDKVKLRLAWPCVFSFFCQALCTQSPVKAVAVGCTCEVKSQG